MTTFRAAAIVLAAILAGSAPGALAQTSAQPAPAAAAPTDPALVPPVAAAFGAASAVDEADLRRASGREDVATLIASAAQRNTVSNNSVTGNSVTGAVRIDGNAFQNLQGLAVISANSGNNVAINSAMNVTVNLAPR